SRPAFPAGVCLRIRAGLTRPIAITAWRRVDGDPVRLVLTARGEAFAPLATRIPPGQLAPDGLRPQQRARSDVILPQRVPGHEEEDPIDQEETRRDPALPAMPRLEHQQP